jgi:WD40 repeat protein
MPACPYVGLQPYTEADRDYFFGREEEIETIAANLISAPLTLVYGASGVGKSSVLMAGVVPYLRQIGTAVVVFRTWQDQTCFAKLKSDISAELNHRRKTPLVFDESLPLDDFVAGATAAARRNLVVIFDQFEEYFLYHSAEAFDEEFARAVNRQEIETNFLIALREDGLAQMDRFQGRIPNLMSNYLRLEHLKHAGAVNAIRKPLEVYNEKRHSELPAPITIEDALVETLIEQVCIGQVSVGMSGQGKTQTVLNKDELRVELPFLQMVLTKLWHEEFGKGATTDGQARNTTLRLATLERLGGAQNIVRTHFDDVMARFGETQQGICSAFFSHLVTPSGTKIAQLRDDLIAYTNKPADEVTPIFKALTEARVLRTVAPPLDQPNAMRYEIFHDVLAPGMLDWERRYNEKQEQLKAKQEAEEALVQAQQRARERRLRYGLVVAAALVLLFGAITAYAVIQRNDALTQRQIGFARELAFKAQLNLFVDPERSILLALESLQRAYTKEGEEALRSAIGNSLVRLTLRGHEGPVRSADFSPDGKWIVTSSRDKTVRIWDANTGRLLRTLTGHQEMVRGAHFSPDGKLIGSASDDRTARLWDTTTGNLLRELKGHEGQVRDLAFSPDGKFVVTASGDKTARIWDVAMGREVRVLRGHEDLVRQAVYSADGKFIVTASNDRTARIWEAATGREAQVFKGHNERVWSAAFSPDGKFVATGAGDQLIRIWDVQTGIEEFELPGHTDTPYNVVYSRDGKRLLSAGLDHTARIWDMEYGIQQLTMYGHAREVWYASFSPDGEHVVTASEDGTARVWDAVGGYELTVLNADDRLNNAVFHPDGKRAVTVGADQTAQLWDTTTGAQLSVFRGHTETVTSAWFSPDGKLLATASADRTARLWDVETGRGVRVLRGHTDAVRFVAFSSDGKRLATASADTTARIWDAATGQLLYTLSASQEPLNAVVFSNDNQRVVTGGEDRIARVWDVTTGRMLVETPKHDDWILGVAFNPDGKQFAVANSDQAIHIWDALTARAVMTLTGHTSDVTYVVYSSDGKRLLSSSADLSVRVWDALMGDELTSLRGHTERIRSARFSSDNRQIITASNDATARMYLTQVNDLIELARTRVTRQLTCNEKLKYLHEQAECP